MIALLATIDREEARRLTKLVRDLLDTLEAKIERLEQVGQPGVADIAGQFRPTGQSVRPKT